jgi:DNA helicase II / ATP-dependent DNA helicase PcrA
MHIHACAGSGKTTTIIRRVKYLIEECKINPSRILITAFNIDAARSVREKLRIHLSDQRVEK